MRNLKRVLSLALALVMVLGMMVITTSAADFTDAEEIKYEEAVEVMSALGIIKGYTDGSFKPAGTLTRAEAAKILAFVMLGDEADNYLTGSGAVFTDVAATSWAAKYVAYCKNVGVINGVNAEQTVFNPAGTLTVVQFAKMLLAAIEAEGTFTGAGWEENVKKAFNAIPELKATGIKVTNAVITREEACELALAAMKAGETYSNGWYIVGYEAEFGYSDSYADAYIMAKAMDLKDVEIKKHVDTRDSLLEEVYGVSFIAADADAYGRPGVGYEKVVGEKKVIDLFFGETAISFEGFLNGTDGVYAVNDALEAAGVKLTYDEDAQYPQNGAFKVDDEGNFVAIDVTVVEDGKVGTKTLTTTYDITKLTSGKDNVALEIYVANKAITKIIVIETHVAIAEFVKADAKKEIKAHILVDGLKYETEAFETGDVVLYTRVWTPKGYKVTKIVDVAEPFTGKVSSYTSKNVFTIGGETYTVSYGAVGSKSNVEKAIKGFDMTEEYYYWLGANGEIVYAADNNLKEEAPKPDTEYTFAVVLDAAGQNYKPAEKGGLLTNGKDAVEAAEVLKVKLADDTVVVLETAWKYVKDQKTGEITGVKFVNGGETPVVTEGLIKFAVNDAGKVTEIIPADVEGAAGSVTAGKVVVGSMSDILTDKTVIYVEAKGKYEVATGYKNIVSADFDSAVAFADKGVLEAVLLKGFAPAEEVKEGTDHLVYIAGFDYITEWNAEANDGEGAFAYTYTNVYIDGEKDSLTVAVKGLPNKGLYAFNTVTGFGESLLGNKGVVSLIQPDFFVAGGEVVYTNAATEYVEITTKGLDVVDGLPSVKDFASTIQYVGVNAKTGVATVIYFSAVEIEE